MRTLFVSLMHPWPPTRGAAQRTNLIHRCLREHGDVDLLLLNNGSDLAPENLQTLRDDWGLVKFVSMIPQGEHGIWKKFRRFHPSLVDRLAHHVGSKTTVFGTDPRVHQALNECLAARSYDLIVGRFLMSVTKAGAFGSLPVIVDVDAADTGIARARLNAQGLKPLRRAALRYQLHQTEQMVPKQFAACDALWIANESDRSQSGLERARLLPNIPFAPADAPRPSLLPDDPTSRIILMVGTMSWPPNVEGADHFVRDIFPTIRAAVPDAEFHIVGSGVTDDMRQRWAAVPGVRVIGFVEEMVPSYAASAFTVVPIHSGAGTNVKLVDSLAHGRTCVVSSYGHRGYEADLRDQESLCVGADTAGFARACIDLLQNPARRSALARRGAEVVAERYSFEAFRATIAETISKVMSK